MSNQKRNDIGILPSRIGVDQCHVAQALQAGRQLGNIRLDHQHPQIRPLRQEPDDFDRRAFPQIVDVGLISNAVTGNHRLAEA